MPSAVVGSRVQVFQGDVDVSRWVSDWSVRYAQGSVYREFRLTFRGFTGIDPAARWNLYYNVTPGADRQALILRNGILAPDWLDDWTLTTRGERGGIDVPTMTVRGYDWAWRATRRSPRRTLILGGSIDQARDAANRYGAALGRWEFIQAPTMHRAVEAVLRRTGLSARLNIPDYPMRAAVMTPADPPTLAPRRSHRPQTPTTYWEMARQLVEPFKPRVIFEAESATVHYADRLTSVTAQTGQRVELGSEVLRSVRARRLTREQVNRVLVTVPR